jgi:CBS domain-containing protein
MQMTILANSVMAKNVVTVSPETTVAETARRMLMHKVSAIPVVDADHRPLGLVSEGDVMRHFGAQFQNKRAQWLRMLAEGETLSPEFLAEIRLSQHQTREIMHAPVISAGEEASLAELADLMLKHGIKRVPILRDGVLVGIVSRADVVRAVVENLQDLLEPTE